MVCRILDQLPVRKCNACASPRVLHQQEKNEGAPSALGLRAIIQYCEGPVLPLGWTCLVRLYRSTVEEIKLDHKNVYYLAIYGHTQRSI